MATTFVTMTWNGIIRLVLSVANKLTVDSGMERLFTLCWKNCTGRSYLCMVNNIAIIIIVICIWPCLMLMLLAA